MKESPDPQDTPDDTLDAPADTLRNDVPCPACALHCVCGRAVESHVADEMHEEVVLRPDCTLCADESGKPRRRTSLSEAIQWSAEHGGE